MKLKFNLQYFLIFIVLLLVEIFIGVFVRDRFIRPFIGDVLSVIVLFAMIRVMYRGKGIYLAIAVLLFAFGVEFAQYFKLAAYLNLEKGSIPYIMLGATFDPLDLLAYALGTIVNFVLDKKYIKS
jgi:hypothetical protein